MKRAIVKRIPFSKYAAKRKKAIEAIVITKGKRKDLSLLQAGYSEAYSGNPSQFMATNAVKKELNFLQYETDRIKERLEKTRNKAKYKELSDSYVGFKKLGQLIGGNPTERLVISAEERRAVDDAFMLEAGEPNEL